MKRPRKKTIKIIGHSWVIKKGKVQRFLIRQATGPRLEHNYIDVERLIYVEAEYPTCIGCFSQNVTDFTVEDSAKGVICKDCGAKTYYQDTRR